MLEDKLTPASREDLIHSISHGMLFSGRKRTHHWDSINAQVAAEKLIDALTRSGYVIMKKPPLPAHTIDTSWKRGSSEDTT